MSISVNKQTLNAVLTEAQGKTELIALLNEIIDEELAKDEMDTELVDECVQAIIDLESEQPTQSLMSYPALMRYCYANSFKKTIRLRRALLIAAVMAIAASVTLSSSTAFAEQTKNLIFSIISSLGIAADNTDTGKGEIVSIYAEFGKDVTFTVQSEDEIHPENVSIVAVDKNNYERTVPLSECKVYRERLDSTHIMVTYSYEGCACSIIYDMEVAK